MPPRRKSALEDLIRSGLVADGELLRYKSKQGQVMAIGRAREAGIEVEGVAKLLGYTAFEDVAGSKYHRPAEHTHTTTGRNLQGLALLAAGGADGGTGATAAAGRTRKAAQQPEEPAVELLEDENDDLCYICGLGGDLLCCETCPGVFHPGCLGLPAPPPGDYFCPQCRCTVCGAGSSDGVVPTGCQWGSCQRFAAMDSLRQLSRPHIGPPGSSGSGSTKPAAAAAAGEAAAGSAAGAAGAEAMQVDASPGAAVAGEAAAGGGAAGSAGEVDLAAPGAEQGADFSQLLAATHSWQVTDPPRGALEAAAATTAAAAAASGEAAVHCPVTQRWAHLRCFPQGFAQQLQRGTSEPCLSSAEAATASEHLAAACTAGLVPLGSIQEGTRAGGGGGVNEGGVDARAPVPVSLLVVRGAAVATPGDCRGYAPAYSEQQQQELQGALSAALRVLHSCYEPIPDSRTGADILPWLLRGAVLAGGQADYSAVHTALLCLGPAVVAVAVFRCFGDIAELPVLAVRPELQRRNRLGSLLLAVVERLLLQAGAKWLLTPGFTADGQPYLPPLQPPPTPLANGQQQQQQQAEAPKLLQARWGYRLAPADVALAACQHPLVRMPGVLLACKQLSADSVVPPPRLARRLEWSGVVGDARQLLREGMLASVAPAPGAAAAAAVAAAAAKAAAPPPDLGRPRPGRPPKAPVAAAPAPAPKPTSAAAPAAEQRTQQALTPAAMQQQQHLQQQQVMNAMYQQLLVQQARMQPLQQAAQPGQPASQAQLMALYQQQQQMAYMQQLQQQQPEVYAQLVQQQQAAMQQQYAQQLAAQQQRQG